MNNIYVSCAIKQPNDVILTKDGLTMSNDEIKLSITETMVDELTEVGTHTIQFFLYDSAEKINRITIPEVSFEVKEPIV